MRSAIVFVICLVLGFCSNHVSAQDIFVPPSAEIDRVVGVVAIAIPDWLR